MRVRQWGAAVASGLLISGGAVLAGPQAGLAACGGSWRPDGALTAEFIPSTAGHTFTEFVAVTTFRFTRAQLDNLKCTGSSAFEVDAQAYGGVPRHGIKSWSSNLPGRYIDTEFSDKGPRVLTVGSRSVDQLEANKEYYTRIRLREITPSADPARLQLAFQRGRWAKGVKEQISCKGHGGSDPAWCVFADQSVPMSGETGGPAQVSLRSRYQDTSTVFWGSYRRTQLTSGEQLGPGDRRYSPNGLNVLFMRADGTLIEYIPGGRTVWGVKTGKPRTVFRAQPDGNMVLIAPGNRAVWSTRTSRHPGSVLQLQNDRNLVIYAPGHRAVWSNAIAGRG
ncbi:hypothetical protein AB0J83_39720 [Actinoplanes sp. NPDC049596]|uniref:hypothetical protein n=1 Tax=unclassified Actinoplanes TaxID=2626549 RepID=UPI0034211CDC